MKCKKHPLTQTAVLASVLAAILGSATMARAISSVTQVEFIGTSDPNRILIRANGPIQFEKQENPADKQVIIELKNARLANGNVGRSLDTSSFKSKISLISPYQVEGKDTVRVVVQMREMGAADVKTVGNALQISVAGPAAGTVGDRVPAQADPAPAEAAPAETQPYAEAPQAEAPAPSLPQAAGGSAGLRTFEENRETRRFQGKPITLQVRDADAADVFRLIGEASGFNIILGEDVKGKVTLSLVDVPWDLALDTVLSTLRLGAERSNNILRVMTLENLTSEKMAQLKAKKASEASAARVTKVFPISYADLKELAALLARFGTSSQAGADNSGSSTGVVEVDTRTNSIIVRDIPDNIERMKKLVEILDTQTPQVIIEAKIVEATENFGASISGGLGMSKFDSTGEPRMLASVNATGPLDGLLGTAGVFARGTDIASGNLGAGTLAASPSLGFISNSLRLNAILNIGENESQVKVVSSPKTVVLNKQKASIVQSTPVLIPTTTIVNNTTIITNSVQQAKLSLEVTPNVTNDGSVLMDLNVMRDIPFGTGSQAAVAERNMKTNVIVESGTTLVIGGVYTMSNTSTSSGFPILRDIPILGWLFGTKSSKNERSELFIFITPRILNEREAGLTSGT